MDPIRNLKSIQVFQLVFAHRNVSRAAEALNSSQSAVSYHIKKLEDDLGVALFRRTARGLEPTDEGAALAADVDQGLAVIRAGLVRVGARAGSVRVAMLPMFGSRWLSPRLGGFWEKHPGLQLSILNHNNSYVRMERAADFADLGIQWGRGPWPKFDCVSLWPEHLVVVCSPDYRAAKAIEAPSDLGRCTLLHVDDTGMWEEWHSRLGLPLSPRQPQMMLEDRHFQLSATANGLGVSLFASWLVEEELRVGKLVNPFGCVFRTSFAYHLVQPSSVRLSAAASQFNSWIMDSMRRDWRAIEPNSPLRRL